MRYSSEWFWAKVLHCARTAPDVFKATKRWIELTDYIPYVLTGEIVPGLYRKDLTNIFAWLLLVSNGAILLNSFTIFMWP